MNDSRERRHPDTGSFVDWTREPEFVFSSEVDALETLIELGEELKGAREQLRQTMRYLSAAVIAARQQADASPTAIINHSGLSRRTVYRVLGLLVAVK